MPALARAVPIAVGVVVLMAGVFQFTAWTVYQLACCREAPGERVARGIGVVVVGAGLFLIARAAGLQAGFTYIGFMNALFGSAPIRLIDWGLAAVLALLLFAIVETEKWIMRGRYGVGYSH